MGTETELEEKTVTKPAMAFELPEDVIWVPVSIRNHNTLLYPISQEMKDETRLFPWPIKLQDNGQGPHGLKNAGGYLWFKQLGLHGLGMPSNSVCAVKREVSDVSHTPPLR